MIIEKNPMFKTKFLLIIYASVILIYSKPLVASEEIIEKIPLEQLRFQPTTQDDWKIDGNFSVYFDFGSGACRYSEVFRSVNKENLIKSIQLRKLLYNNLKPEISIIFNKKYNAYSEYLSSKLKFEIYPYSNSGSLSTPIQFQRSLQFFYKINAIPDFIIDRVLEFPEFGVHDFRLNADKLITKIEQKFTPSDLDDTQNNLKDKATDQVMDKDLQDFICAEIATIHNSQQRQETCWGVAQYLQQQDYCPVEIIMTLYQQIQDKSLTFYSTAQELLAAHQFAQNPESKLDVYQRYRQPLITLLRASEADAQQALIPSLLPTLIKSFVNNDKLSDDLPDALNSLKLTPEHMFELLNLYRLQRNELVAQSNEIATLKAQNSALLKQISTLETANAQPKHAVAKNLHQ